MTEDEKRQWRETSSIAKRIREIIERAAKAAGAAVLTSTLEAACRACGQRNRWEAGRPAKCGKCGYPLPDTRVLH